MSELIITTTNYHMDDYERNSSQSIEIEHGDKSFSYTVGESEPEDMIFGRELEDVSAIEKMIQLAYDCGKQGIPIKFQNVEGE